MQAPKAGGSAGAPSWRRGDRLDALLVEDEANVRVLLKRSLQAEGFSVDSADDGQKALNMLGAKRYDLLVTDLRMPGVHGHALVSQIIAEHPRPLIVVLTGVTDPKLVSDLYVRGVDDVMFKPVDFRAFATKMKCLVERRKSEGDGRGKMDSGATLDRMGQTTEYLRAQLAQIQQNFAATIREMEEQQRNLENSFVDSVRVFSSLTNLLSGIEGSHASRVEDAARALGETCQYSANELRDLKIASLLHEIGLFGMPDTVRSKAPWQLNVDERKLYERYPSIGATLLSEIQGAGHIVEVIEAHMEHYDGSGFPKGLHGEQIPLSGRILQVADGCDTFLMYHSGDKDEVFEHIRAESGKKYDPKLVPPAIQYHKERLRRQARQNVIQLHIGELKAGQVLAESVVDDQGRLLVREGATITEPMLGRLREILVGGTLRVIESNEPAPSTRERTQTPLG